MHWQGSIVLLPVIYLIYRSYQLYLARLEDERRHVESIAGLHMRTIEALALAIEAKDHTTHEHLRRVRVYAVEIGKQMGLATQELEALKAAALLHDIGKLAVPEHIISKPGRLTPEEFEKMKIHPVVGAEILERVSFPYPVAPDRARASRKVGWNRLPLRLAGRRDSHRRAHSVGSRLPGRAGFRPPIPARYGPRRGHARSGRTGRQEFRPRVVLSSATALMSSWSGWRKRRPESTAELSTDVRIEKGAEPAAGFQGVAPHACWQ